MKTYLDCWARMAATLFSQALAGEPELLESAPRVLGDGSFGFAATLAGDCAGQFTMIVDGAVLETPLVGEGVDQKAGWGELLRETVDAAASELLARTGRNCRVERFEEAKAGNAASLAFQLRAGGRAWTILIRDEVRESTQAAGDETAAQQAQSTDAPAIRPGIELLLDVEMEASLRFGSREMPLGEILDLGPGDVVQLDRQVADPVDLIVGDKIVARGEVVLVNGNFGLRVTEVASPKKRLESIRCLF